MKKTRAFILALVAATVAMAPLSSCSSDDNDESNNGGGNDTELSKYAALATQYTIDDKQAAVRSIELTESGRYIVVMNDIQKSATKRAAEEEEEEKANDMFYGTYTAGTDNKTFLLEGFGTLKVNDNGTVTVTSENIGGTKTWKASSTKGKELSSIEKRLCRTWTVKSIRWFQNDEYKGVWDVTASTLPEIYKKLFGDDTKWGDHIDWVTDHQPQEYTFTRTGFVIVKSTKNAILNFQRWRMKSDTEMQVWTPGENDNNYNGIPDEDEWNHWLFEYADEGHLNVRFSDNRLIITETEDDYGNENGWEYTFEEAK